MYKQKISIVINSDFEREKLFDEFEILLGNLYKTGQILGEYETPFFVGNEIIAYQTTIEKKSLSSEFFDEYTLKNIENLQNWANTQFKTEIIGIAIPEFKEPCQCTTHTYLILFTHLFNNTSPIDCGTCFRPVPIYKLKLNYSLRLALFAWERNYKACDQLQINCMVGEKWATKQMSDANSELSVQGRNICRDISVSTGFPTYYYLFNYRHITYKQDISRLCPSCGGDWFLQEKINNFYDFKCDNCLLIYSISSNLKP